MKVKVSRNAVVIWTIVASLFGVGLKYGVLDRSWLDESDNEVVVTPDDPVVTPDEPVKKEMIFMVSVDSGDVATLIMDHKKDFEEMLSNDEIDYKLIVSEVISEETDVYVGSIMDLVDYKHLSLLYKASYTEENDEVYYIRKSTNYSLDQFSDLVKTNIGVYTPLSILQAYKPLLDVGVKPGSNTGLIEYNDLDRLVEALKTDVISSVALSELTYNAMNTDQKNGLFVYKSETKQPDLVVAYKSTDENPFEKIIMQTDARSKMVESLSVLDLIEFELNESNELYKQAKLTEIYR
jgi:hypothetical protein